MKREDRILCELLARQADVFRVACDPMRYGLTFKRIQLATSIPPSTLRTYTEGRAEMPISALYKLVGIIPGHLLSMLLPDGFAIVEVPEDIDHDDLAPAFQEYLAAKGKAHHPDSPEGPAIAECEREALDNIVVQIPLRGRVRA